MPLKKKENQSHEYNEDLLEKEKQNTLRLETQVILVLPDQIKRIAS